MCIVVCGVFCGEHTVRNVSCCTMAPISCLLDIRLVSAGLAHAGTSHAQVA